MPEESLDTLLNKIEEHEKYFELESKKFQQNKPTKEEAKRLLTSLLAHLDELLDLLERAASVAPLFVSIPLRMKKSLLIGVRDRLATKAREMSHA